MVERIKEEVGEKVIDEVGIDGDMNERIEEIEKKKSDDEN